MNKKQSKGEITREQFLDLAIQEIAHKGTANLSAVSLVKDSNLTRSTFYSYFGDLDGLLADLWIERGVTWLERMVSKDKSFNFDEIFIRSLAEVFLLAHRNSQIREVVRFTLKRFLAKFESEPAAEAIAMWRLANRLGIVATKAVWFEVLEGVFLDDYLDSIEGKIKKLNKTEVPDLPEIELEVEDESEKEILLGVIQIIASSGLKGFSILRLGRLLRVTSGYLNPRIYNQNELIGTAYKIAQTSAAKQNLALWASLKLRPEGFARFIVGSVGNSRQSWRWFRSEVMIAATHDVELAKHVSPSMTLMIDALQQRTAKLGFPKQLIRRVAILVHTLLFGFTALQAAGLEVKNLSHEGLIRALLAEVAKRFVRFSPK